jgi:uncharacterized repeat protein (TIGR03943 family)
MSREVQAVIMLLFGSATLRITLTDTYLNYVKPAMKPWLIVSASILCLLGLLLLLDAFRRQRVATAQRQESDEHGHGHSHAHGPGIAWLMLLPVLTIFLVAPPALGSYTASRDLTNAIPSNAQLLPLPDGDPVEIYVSDYINRAVWYDGETLDGRTFAITGFVTPNPEGGWWLTRLSLACCAADAFSGRIQVVDAPFDWESPPADTWVVVTGRWVPGGGTQSDLAIPLISVEGIEQIPQPTNPYD